MRRLDPTFKAVSSLSGLDERDSNTAGYTFCHVAAVYQLYMQDPTIVEESNDERLCRSKLLSKLLAEIFLEGLSAYKVCLTQGPAMQMHMMTQIRFLYNSCKQAIWLLCRLLFIAYRPH